MYQLCKRPVSEPPTGLPERDDSTRWAIVGTGQLGLLSAADTAALIDTENGQISVRVIHV